MRLSSTTRLRSVYKHGGLVLAVLFVMCLAGGGCAKMESLIDDIGKPEPEIAIQSGAYGTVTQVTTGKMQGREIRMGDIALTVDLDNGGVVIIIQSEDDIYVVGDRVRVIRDGEKYVRVQLAI